MKKIRSWSLFKKIIVSILLFLVLILASIGIQVGVNLAIDSIPQRPDPTFDSGGAERLLYYYDEWVNGNPLPDLIELSETFVNQELEGTFAYINGRYDVADFRMNSLIRLYLGYEAHLPDSTKAAIQEVMLSFKYWMDQGGEDSMCYWSENHQILFATEEYLVGQTFPNAIFSVDGKTGQEHMEMAKIRINSWMEQRFLYGFTEWYSNNYYPEDIGPMANFIQFASDPVMVNRMKMIMDLIWFDMASQSYQYVGEDSLGEERTYYVFVSSSGRMYSDNRVSDDIGNRMRKFIDFVIQPDATEMLPDSWRHSTNGFFQCFKQMMQAKDGDNNPFYQVPEVIQAIFTDPAPEKIIRSSQSLNVSELETEGLLGQEVNQIMMQFNMEAFTNPEVIENTMDYIAHNNMFSNDFLNDFKLVNIWPLRALNLLGFVSETLKPATNGVAIERANVYTYKTDYYSMHTAQVYQPGAYADQQAISSLNLANDLSIFTTQPAKIPRRSGTPTYWTGNGRQPYSVQEKNVQLAIYLPPTKAGFMEPMVIPETTHVFFPVELFDQVDESKLDEGMIFGQKGDTYVAILSRYPLAFVPYATSIEAGNTDDMLVRGSAKDVLSEKYDLVQLGEGYHYFIIEASDAESETFAEFQSRILENQKAFAGDIGRLEYQTILNNQLYPTTLEATYGADFTIDEVIQNLEYPRIQSEYVTAGITPRKADTIAFAFAGKTLTINYQDNLRTVGD